MRLTLALWLVLLWQFCAHSQEQTVRVTVFELTDGRTIEALRVSSAESNGVKQYAVKSTGGDKLRFTGDQIKAAADKWIQASGVAAETHAQERPGAASKSAPPPVPVPHERQDPVEVTVFKLRDGRTIEAVDVTERETGGRSNFELITADGSVQTCHDENVLSKSTKRVDFDSLPSDMQGEVAAARAARKRNIDRAAQNVNDKTHALDRAQKNLALAETKGYEPAGRMAAGDHGDFHQYSIENEELLVRNIDIEIAFRQAEIDGSRLQINTAIVPQTTTPGAWGMGKLQEIMKNDAAEIAKLKQKKEDLLESIKTYKEFIAKMKEDVDAKNKELDKAKRKLAQAIQSKLEIYPLNTDKTATPKAAANDKPEPGIDAPFRKRMRDVIDDE